MYYSTDHLLLIIVAETYWEALESFFSKKKQPLVVSAGVGTVVGRPPLMSKSSIIVVFFKFDFCKINIKIILYLTNVLKNTI